VRAAVYNGVSTADGGHLRIEEVPRPKLQDGHVLLRVIACGVCRTDLHIVEGDLPPLRPQLIPGHQIVGEVVEGATEAIPMGSRVGVSWMGGTDGNCWFCKHQMENLCDHPTFTGYTVDGGYAEYALVRSDFTYPLPQGLDEIHVAPLLCAGIIGFRSLRVAGVQPGERVGLFGFGSSATLAIPILQSWGCETYVVTRGAAHRATACKLDATWVGREDDRPPVLRWTGQSHSLRAARSSSMRFPVCERAEWWRSTPFISTRCRPSTTTSSYGESGRFGVSPI
jgi:propanol-preferring alcohol dehydrogenase